MNIEKDVKHIPVHELFADRAAAAPDAVAAVAGPVQRTYREIDRRSNQLARHLRGLGAGPDSVVAVLLDDGIDRVVALLAILKAGGVYFPIEPTTPERRLRSLLGRAGTSVLLTGPGRAREFFGLPMITVEVDDPAIDRAEPAAPDTRPGPDQAAYLIFTSGSTGSPKGVVVEHGSLGYVCTRVAAVYRTGPADRVLQFGAASFDTSIEQMVTTLISGGTLVFPERTWAPSEMPQRLDELGVTVADLTPAYWRRFVTAIAHGAPRPRELRLVIVGGEAVSAEDCRMALRELPSVQLINAYGLTETTITSTTMTITPESLRYGDSAPIGKPLPGTVVEVLDRYGDPVPSEVRGELYLGGPGLARGYLNNEELTEERFVPDPTGRHGRMYRTGDLGRWRADGNLELLGRVDRQVKVRGFRVEPTEIETALGRHRAVGEAVVVPYPRNGETGLAAYFTLDDTRAGEPTPGALREFLSRRLPAYLVPSAFRPLPDLPLTPSGKVDRAALPAPRPEPVPAEAEAETGTGTADPAEHGMRRLWCQVLDLDDVAPEDNFFDLGGNSLLAAELLARARKTFGLLLTQVRPLIRLLLRDATLRGFTNAVRDARAGTLPDDAGEDLRAAAELDVRVAPAGPASPGTARWSAPADILLTGATGFFGSYLLAELLAGTEARIHCLVRANDRDDALARIAATGRRYGHRHGDGGLDGGRIVPVVGDLAKPQLGLGNVEFDALADTVDVIHHPGGEVNFIYPYSRLSAANVGGTRELIRMAARGRNIPIHYVSTMAVIAGYGLAGVREVTEETALGYPEYLSVGYVETKWVAEALLRSAAERGLPVAIYRPADISGDTVTGAWNTATEMCAVTRFIADSGLAPEAALPLDYVPVDRYAAAVAHIASTTAPHGTVYHLTNPGKGYVGDLADRLRARGHAVRDVPWDDWIDALVATAVDQPDHPMAPFAPLFIDRCATGTMSVAEMYLETTFPAFTRTNATEALRGSGIEIPEVDAAMLDRYLGYLGSIGYLPAP